MPPMPNRARPDLSKEPQHKVRFFTPPTDFIAYYVEAESRNIGSIELPDSVLSYSSVVGRVIACGPKVAMVKPGDRILLSPNLMAGLVRHQGKICYISQEAHIQGVLDAATADDPSISGGS